MASQAAAGPFRGTFRFFQRHAHENPAVFWAIVIGTAGPIAAAVIPPVRRSFGYQAAERIPSTYPLPKRAREEVSGYDDEE